MRGLIIKPSSTGLDLADNQSLIKIVLTSYDGTGISGVTFTVASQTHSSTVVTDENGKAEALVPTGTYSVSCAVSSDYEQPAAQSVVTAGGVEYTQNFHLYSNVNPTTINLTSFDNAGISGVTLTISGSGNYSRTFPASGIVNINLPSGTYTFTISGNDTRYVTPAAQTKTMTRGASTTINFNLASNVAICNTTLTSSDGNNIAGVVLTITKSGTTQATYTFTSSGTHSIELPSGTYVWTISNVPNGYDTPPAQTKTVVIANTYSLNFNMPERSTVIYGVRITKSNSSPSHIIYTDDAVGLSPSVMSSAGVLTDYGWTTRLSELFGIKPCVFNNGAVNYYLNPDNYNQKANGSASVLTGADGDVMVEFEKKGYMSITSDATYIYVKVSNVKVDSTYTDWPFSYKGVIKNKFYIGAYLGYVTGGALYSRSDVAPTASQAITTFITNAHARGTGYEIVPFNKLILLQVLYLIRFKSLDSQTAVGRGYTGASAKSNTGATNAQGMNYGTTGATTHVKVNGIEDFWGNLVWFIDGLFCDSSRNIRVGDKDIVSASNGTGYTTKATISANVSGYITDIHATNELGFLIKTGSGSETTYYCDYGYCGAGCVGFFGGSWYYGSFAGFCRLYVSSSLSYSDEGIGARLAWCGV